MNFAANRRAVVRAPNHLGDVVMALPAIRAAGDADVLVLRWLAPILEMAGLPGEVIPMDRGGGGYLRAAAELRRRRFERGILLPPSFASALVFAAGGVRRRRGTATDGRRVLLHDPVPKESIRDLHRSAAYQFLVTGEVGPEPPVPSLTVPPDAAAHFGEIAPPTGDPVVGIFPGSNASSRRWHPDRYAELVRQLGGDGVRVLVFGSPAEKALTRSVAGTTGIDLGGRTDIRTLAAGLAACDLLVTNDTGPMHLAAAVGTRTLSLQGPADPAVTRPLGSGHRMVRHTELSCVPCVKNVCPRRGRGQFLEDAGGECMALITVEEVVAGVGGGDWKLTVNS